MTCSVDVSQLSPLVTPVAAQRVHEPVAMESGWRLCWDQQQELSLFRAYLDIAIVECPLCQ